MTETTTLLPPPDTYLWCSIGGELYILKNLVWEKANATEEGIEQKDHQPEHKD